MRNVLFDCHQDPFSHNPLEEYDGIEIVSFNRRHRAFKRPEDVGFRGVNKYGELQWSGVMARRIKAQTVWVLSYHEHGQSIWGLPGEVPRCEWDTAPLGGLLIFPALSQLRKEWYWPSFKDADKRTDFVRSLLKQYTAWANGWVYEISVSCEDDDDAEYYGQLYGDEQLQQMYEELMDQHKNDKVTLCGDLWIKRLINERKEIAHV